LSIGHRPQGLPSSSTSGNELGLNPGTLEPSASCDGGPGDRSGNEGDTILTADLPGGLSGAFVVSLPLARNWSQMVLTLS
jgi:hypothetical protein